MNQQEIAHEVETKISALFDELRSGMAEREDSRAFGAMIERRITDNWISICNDLGYDALDRREDAPFSILLFAKITELLELTLKLKISIQHDIQMEAYVLLGTYSNISLTTMASF